MKTSDNIQDIAKALVAAQKEIASAKKTATNPFFKSKYADLGEVIDAIKGPLNAHGIAFLQLCDNGNGDTVTTVLLHESGQFIATETKVHAKADDPQAFGSGVTYAKRYALQAALGLPTEDDDGNAAAGRAEPKTRPQPKQPAAQGEKTVPERAWEQYKATFQGDLPEGCIWDFNRFVTAVKARFAGKLPTKEESIAKILAANIPHVECWRANDEKAAA